MIKHLLIIFCLSIFIFSCKGKDDETSGKVDKGKSTMSIDRKEPKDGIVDKYSAILENAIQTYNYNKTNDYFLIINTTEQKMYFIKDNKLIGNYLISTGKAGEGNQWNSGKTPLGYHKITEKIGDNAPVGTIFVGKQNTGKISKIYTDATDIENDPVITRILSLDGLEDGYNKGGDVDSYKRSIYIHGTHEEGLLGIRASHGCIRMYNKEVISLFNTAPKNTIVYITQ